MKLTGDPTDRADIEAAQAGRSAAFDRLANRYLRRATGHATAICGELALAQDAVQEALLRAWLAIDRFDVRLPFYPWLYRILRNVCLNLLAKRRGSSLADADAYVPDHAPSPETLAETDERSRLVWDAIFRLPTIHREIVVLAHFEHKSYAEMAVMLGIPRGTVMSRLFNARKRLRGLLEGVIT